MRKKKYLEAMAMVNLMMEERANTWEQLGELQRDLMKMNPKSSQTMSAMRQREISQFVIDRLDFIRGRM